MEEFAVGEDFHRGSSHIAIRVAGLRHHIQMPLQDHFGSRFKSRRGWAADDDIANAVHFSAEAIFLRPLHESERQLFFMSGDVRHGGNAVKVLPYAALRQIFTDHKPPPCGNGK